MRGSHVAQIDFTRISESWKDAKHDATIPPATASRLHFLPFPRTFLTPRPGRHVFEADKHAEASRKRPAPVLSLVRLFITRYMLALSVGRVGCGGAFTVCHGLKCDVSPHFPVRWSNILFMLTTRKFNATNQLFQILTNSNVLISDFLSFPRVENFSRIFPGIFFKVLDNSLKILTTVLNARSNETKHKMKEFRQYFDSRTEIF